LLLLAGPMAYFYNKFFFSHNFIKNAILFFIKINTGEKHLNRINYI